MRQAHSSIDIYNQILDFIEEKFPEIVEHSYLGLTWMLDTIENESFYQIVDEDDDELYYIKEQLLDKYEQLNRLFYKGLEFEKQETRKLQSMSEQQKQHYVSEKFEKPMTKLIERITDLEKKKQAFYEKIRNPRKLTYQQKSIARQLGWTEKKGFLTPEQKKTVSKNFRNLVLKLHPDKDKTKTQQFKKINNVKQILLDEYIDL